MDESTGVFTSGENTGDCIVTVTAAGDNCYERSSKTITVTVTDKSMQELTFTNAMKTKTYGDADFTVAAIHSLGDGVVTYQSSDSSVATVDNTAMCIFLRQTTHS